MVKTHLFHRASTLAASALALAIAMEYLAVVAPIDSVIAACFSAEPGVLCLIVHFFTMDGKREHRHPGACTFPVFGSPVTCLRDGELFAVE